MPCPEEAVTGILNGVHARNRAISQVTDEIRNILSAYIWTFGAFSTNRAVPRLLSSPILGRGLGL